MHRMWTVEDIVRIVHSHGTRGAAASLGRTCRWLFACSMPFVWQDVPDLKVMDVLLRDLWKSAIDLTCDLEEELLLLFDNIQSHEESDRIQRSLGRLRFYSAYVKKLGMQESDRDAALRLRSVVPRDEMPTTFSHLQKVSMWATRPGTAEIFTVFVTPRVSKVSLTISTNYWIPYVEYSRRFVDFKTTLKQFLRLDDLQLRGADADVNRFLTILTKEDQSTIVALKESELPSSPLHTSSPFHSLLSLGLHLQESWAGLPTTESISRISLPQVNVLDLGVERFGQSIVFLTRLDAPNLGRMQLSSEDSWEDGPTLSSSLRQVANVIRSAWPVLLDLSIKQVGPDDGSSVRGYFKVSAIEPLFSCHALEHFHLQIRRAMVEWDDDETWCLATSWPNLRTLTLRSATPVWAFSFGAIAPVTSRSKSTPSLRSLEYLATFCPKLEKLRFDPILEYTDHDSSSIGQDRDFLPARNASCTTSLGFQFTPPSMSKLHHLDVGYAPRCDPAEACYSLRRIFPELRTFEFAAFSEQLLSRVSTPTKRYYCRSNQRVQCMSVIQAGLASPACKVELGRPPVETPTQSTSSALSSLSGLPVKPRSIEDILNLDDSGYWDDDSRGSGGIDALDLDHRTDRQRRGLPRDLMMVKLLPSSWLPFNQSMLLA